MNGTERKRIALIKSDLAAARAALSTTFPEVGPDVTGPLYRAAQALDAVEFVTTKAWTPGHCRMCKSPQDGSPYKTLCRTCGEKNTFRQRAYYRAKGVEAWKPGGKGRPPKALPSLGLPAGCAEAAA
jgi:hypothetical protein